MAEHHTEWTPFVAGEHCRPAYYRTVRPNPRIDPEADVEDVLHAFGVDCPRVAEAVRKLLRAGRKPGEPRAKEIAKACETLQRELSYLAMEPARKDLRISVTECDHAEVFGREPAATISVGEAAGDGSGHRVEVSTQEAPEQIAPEPRGGLAETITRFRRASRSLNVELKRLAKSVGAEAD